MTATALLFKNMISESNLIKKGSINCPTKNFKDISNNNEKMSLGRSRFVKAQLQQQNYFGP